MPLLKLYTIPVFLKAGPSLDNPPLHPGTRWRHCNYHRCLSNRCSGSGGSSSSSRVLILFMGRRSYS